MQNTRLNSFFSNLSSQARQLFLNPWRRITLLLISLLVGIFMGITLVTSAGQLGRLDIFVAAIVLLFTELINWFFYRRLSENNNQTSGGMELLNTFKLGLTYSLYIQAFVLGS